MLLSGTSMWLLGWPTCPSFVLIFSVSATKTNSLHLISYANIAMWSGSLFKTSFAQVINKKICIEKQLNVEISKSFLVKLKKTSNLEKEFNEEFERFERSVFLRLFHSARIKSKKARELLFVILHFQGHHESLAHSIPPTLFWGRIKALCLCHRNVYHGMAAIHVTQST